MSNQKNVRVKRKTKIYNEKDIRNQRNRRTQSHKSYYDLYGLNL